MQVSPFTHVYAAMMRDGRTEPSGCSPSGSGPLSLIGVQVSIMDSAECNRSSPYRGRIRQDMLCARGTDAAACHVRPQHTYEALTPEHGSTITRAD